MTGVDQGIKDVWFLSMQGLGHMVSTLRDKGYTVVAPTARDGVISFAEIVSVDQIASGVRDEMGPGHYRLIDDPLSRPFNYVVGQDSPKRFFFPPKLDLVSMHIEGKRFVLDSLAPKPPKLAILGVRPCDLAAIHVQDRVFGFGESAVAQRCEADSYYNQARKQSLLIAVNCTQPASTCFCDSVGTGPRAKEGFDLSMTELGGGFILRAGSDQGRAVVSELPVRDPSPSEIELGQLKIDQAVERMGRKLDTDRIMQLLDEQIDHPSWDEVAKRCMTCSNCTMVCPTCFCSTVTDSNDLATGAATRTRQWESCFTHQFSYTTAGPVRGSTRARYRHWLRHKLGTWWHQFGESGCVGCGRCITWCPVGIDITEQAHRLRHHDPSNGNGAEQTRERGMLV